MEVKVMQVMKVMHVMKQAMKVMQVLVRWAESAKPNSPGLRFLSSFLFAIVLAAPSAAHHSGAMFDDQKSLTLKGTVAAFQWTNPHCWIQLTVAGEPAVEWSIEMGAPTEVFRGGWRPGTLKAGETIEVVVRPMRDGTPGGLFVAAKRADGTAIGRQ